MQGRWVAIAWLIGVGALLAQEPEPGLKVVSEVACADLFGPGTYEASGLVLAEGRLHLVFDNLAQVGSLTPDLDPASGALSPGRVGFSDYEAIAYDPPLVILDELEALEEEIQQGMTELREMLM